MIFLKLLTFFCSFFIEKKFFCSKEWFQVTFSSQKWIYRHIRKWKKWEISKFYCFYSELPLSFSGDICYGFLGTEKKRSYNKVEWRDLRLPVRPVWSCSSLIFMCTFDSLNLHFRDSRLHTIGFPPCLDTSPNEYLGKLYFHRPSQPYSFLPKWESSSCIFLIFIGMGRKCNGRCIKLFYYIF